MSSGGVCHYCQYWACVCPPLTEPATSQAAAGADDRHQALVDAAQLVVQHWMRLEPHIGWEAPRFEDAIMRLAQAAGILEPHAPCPHALGDVDQDGVIHCCACGAAITRDES